LLAGDTADLGHTDRDRKGSAYPKPIDAGDQVQSLAQVTVLADIGNKRLELDPEDSLQTGDFSLPVPLCARVAAGLVSVFCPSHVLGNLLHEGQTLSKRDQSRIRRGVDLAHVSRAKRDQSGIYLVVLRALQVKLRIGAHLRGLEHNHHKTPSAQLRYHLPLISAARLNTYALDPMLAEAPTQSSVALSVVLNL